MLFRFREAQAAELGLSGRTDRRPRVASSCTDLRQCERWRGEILRDISRKVSKIQDGELMAAVLSFGRGKDFTCWRIVVRRSRADKRICGRAQLD